MWMGHGEGRAHTLILTLSLSRPSAEAICMYSIECTYRYTKPKPKILTDSVLDAMIDMQVTLLELG